MTDLAVNNPLAVVIDRLAAIVGPQHVLTDPGDTAPYVTDWRGMYHGSTPAVVRPAGTAEVAAIVSLCAQARVALVPQGGNTGQCCGAVPRTGLQEIVLSLARMNRVLDIDPLNNTITVEAGCVLANIQQAALDADRLFPLSLGSEGSCQIGGNLSTNAGGVNVLRYGNARDLVLGLEAVLPDGRIWNGLRGLRKDNTGYDLKHLFIGAEGTLGIITAAVLKLFPRPRATVTAWIAVATPDHALRLLSALRGEFIDAISTYELMARNAIDLVIRHIPGARDPLAARHDWYVLAELTDARDDGTLHAAVESCLSEALEAGRVVDVVIAENQTAASAFRRLREAIPEATRLEPTMLYRHDIAVAVGKVPAFIDQAGVALAQRIPGAVPVCYGHLGDGNLHYNVFVEGRRRTDPEARAARDVNDVVLDLVHDCGGSVSAEHGIGLAKVEALARYKSATERDLMRIVKHALDPNLLMNPGKVL